jgi:hypothetical protein
MCVAGQVDAAPGERVGDRERREAPGFVNGREAPGFVNALRAGSGGRAWTPAAGRREESEESDGDLRLGLLVMAQGTSVLAPVQAEPFGCPR